MTCYRWGLILVTPKQREVGPEGSNKGDNEERQVSQGLGTKVDEKNMTKN